MTLPGEVQGIIGGLSQADRYRLRRAQREREAEQRQREAEAAQLAAGRKCQNEYNRRSEKLRRQLGKAPSTRRRYAAGEAEMFKAPAASYYAAHREEVIARTRGRYQAGREEINARRREADAGEEGGGGKGGLAHREQI